MSRDSEDTGSLDGDSLHGLESTRDALARARDGAAEGWEALFAKLDDRLRVLAFFRMTSRVRAIAQVDDLLQDVFAIMTTTLERFEYRGPGSLDRWAAGILRHRIAELERAKYRIPTTVLEKAPVGLDRERHAMFAALDSTRRRASHEARRSELIERVRVAVSALADEMREVILLSVYEGQSGAEIARRIGVSESTVSARLRAGLTECARVLKGFAP